MKAFLDSLSIKWVHIVHENQTRAVTHVWAPCKDRPTREEWDTFGGMGVGNLCVFPIKFRMLWRTASPFQAFWQVEATEISKLETAKSRTGDAGVKNWLQSLTIFGKWIDLFQMQRCPKPNTIAFFVVISMLTSSCEYLTNSPTLYCVCPESPIIQFCGGVKQTIHTFFLPMKLSLSKNGDVLSHSKRTTNKFASSSSFSSQLLFLSFNRAAHYFKLKLRSC